MNSARNATASAMAQRQDRPDRRARPKCACPLHRRHVSCRHRRMSALEAPFSATGCSDIKVFQCAVRTSAASRLISEKKGERADQHHRGDRRGVGVAEFLEPDDDQQRRDLGYVGQVACNEDDRAVFTDRACEREREAVRSAGTIAGRMTRRIVVHTRVRPKSRTLPPAPSQDLPVPAGRCAPRRAGR